MQHIVEWPGGESMTRTEAVKASGIPGRVFDRFVEVGIIRPLGKDLRNRRYAWDEVYAVARLWDRLERLLPTEDKGHTAGKD